MIGDIPGLVLFSGECGTEMLVRGEASSINLLNDKLEKYHISARRINRYVDNGTESLLFSCGFIGSGDLLELEASI